MDIFFSKFNQNIVTSVVYKNSLLLSLEDNTIVEINSLDKRRKVVLSLKEKIYEMVSDKYLLLLGQEVVYIVNDMYKVICKIDIHVKFIGTFGDFIVLGKYYDVIILQINCNNLVYNTSVVLHKRSMFNFFGFKFEKKAFDKDVISRSYKSFATNKEKYLQNNEYYDIMKAINISNIRKEDVIDFTVENKNVKNHIILYKIVEYGDKIKGIFVTQKNLIVCCKNVIYFYDYKACKSNKLKFDFKLHAFEYFYNCLIVSSDRMIYRIEACKKEDKRTKKNEINSKNVFENDKAKNTLDNAKTDKNIKLFGTQKINCIYTTEYQIHIADINCFENAERYKCTELFKFDKNVKKMYNINGLIVCDSDYCYKVNYNEKKGSYEKLCISYRRLWKNKLILYDERIFAIEENYLLELKNHTSNFLESITNNNE